MGVRGTYRRRLWGGRLFGEGSCWRRRYRGGPARHCCSLCPESNHLYFDSFVCLFEVVLAPDSGTVADDSIHQLA